MQLGAAASGDLVRYHHLFEVYKWHSSVHAHGMLFSLSSVSVGLLLSRNGFGSMFAETVAGALVLAALVWTLAALRRVRPLMGLADLLFIGAMASVAVGVAGSL